MCYLNSDLLAADQAQQKNQNPSGSSSALDALIEQGRQLRNRGQLAEAISVFQGASVLAQQQRNYVYAARIRIFIGSTDTLAHRYRAALGSLEQAAGLGQQLNDPFLQGSARANLASLYWQLGDAAAARSESQSAIRLLGEIQSPNNRAINGLAIAHLIHAAVSLQEKKSLQGYRDFDEAMKLAVRNKDIPTQALIWDEKGVAFMDEHRLDEAESAFQKAEQVNNLDPKSDHLAITKANLAKLELEKSHPNTQKALQLIDQGFSLPSPTFKSSPQFFPIDIRARVLLAMGDTPLALAEFKKAIEAADQWRTSALPGDTTNTQTAKQLQSVYEDYADLAAEMALNRRDNTLAVKALEVLAQNRAVTLREQLRLFYEQSGKLPDEYYAKLADLQKAQANVTLGGNTSNEQATLQQIRLDISDFENKIGLKSEKIKDSGEKKSRRNSLRDIQSTLSRDQVLLSITLAKCNSYLWSVTATNVNLIRLPGEEELTSEARQFATAIRLRQDASVFANRLSRSLFSGLPADVWNRSEWMLVADGALWNGIPFSALPSLRSGGSRKLLMEEKSIRFLPSELLLVDHRPDQTNSSFVGIGDPIYNQADSRLRGRFADAKTLPDGVTLARLVGSEKEIRSAAHESKAGDTVFLTGPTANRETLTQVLSRQPEIIHFAVHVVSPPDDPQEAALALSLKDGIPELLTPEAISVFHVPGSLVVLSGCSSGQGKVVPGAGLIGLSRAWLLAGAAAVIVSNWPTPDDSGTFFSSFYDHFDRLSSGDIAQRAALALRQTQTDLLMSNGYQSSPAFWGAFAVLAKE